MLAYREAMRHAQERRNHPFCLLIPHANRSHRVMLLSPPMDKITAVAESMRSCVAKLMSDFVEISALRTINCGTGSVFKERMFFEISFPHETLIWGPVQTNVANNCFELECIFEFLADIHDRDIQTVNLTIEQIRHIGAEELLEARAA